MGIGGKAGIGWSSARKLDDPCDVTDRPPCERFDESFVATDCFLSGQPWLAADDPGEALPFPRDDGRKEVDVGEIGESKREKGFFSAG